MPATSISLTAEESAVKPSLDALKLIEKWTDTQRKSLVFLVACLLPTAHIRAFLAYHQSTDSASAREAATQWERAYLANLATALKLDSKTVTAAFPLLERSDAQPIDSTPFIESMPLHSLSDKVALMLVLLHDSLVSCGGYDSRVRHVLRSLAPMLGVRWKFFCALENRYADQLSSEIEKHRADHKEDDRSKILRYMKIGAAAVVGGTLIGLTGGLLAAPLLGAGLASIGLTTAGATVSALVASTGGLVLVTSIFGAAGAGLTGHKMNKRVSGLQEFRFVTVKSIKKQHQEQHGKPKDARGLGVVIAVNGFLRRDTSGYQTVWQCLVDDLAETSEVDVLQWESPILVDFGSALHSIAASEIVKNYAIGKVKTLLIGALLAAVSWPMAVVKATGVIDNSYELALDRSEKAAIELTNVIEARQAGHRPVTLVGFSTGSRLIFRALEELAKRRDERNKHAATAKPAKDSMQQAAKAIATANIDPKLSEEDSKQHTASSSENHSVLTAKGYEELPSDSVQLNADPVLDVYLLGTPLPCSFERFLRVRSMVAGRLVNGYSSNDWLLTFIHSLKSASLNTAGIRPVTRAVSEAAEEADKRQPVDADTVADSTDGAAGSVSANELNRTGDVDGFGIENVNLSRIIDGHIEYEQKVDECLRAAKFTA